MAIKAINNSTSLNRLVFILLVFLLKIYYLVNHHFFSKLGQRDLYYNGNSVRRTDICYTNQAVFIYRW